MEFLLRASTTSDCHTDLPPTLFLLNLEEDLLQLHQQRLQAMSALSLPHLREAPLLHLLQERLPLHPALAALPADLHLQAADQRDPAPAFHRVKDLELLPTVFSSPESPVLSSQPLLFFRPRPGALMRSLSRGPVVLHLNN